MKTTTLEFVYGLVAGVAEGVVEGVIPGSENLTRKLNTNLKTEVPLGVITCEAVKPIAKKIVRLAFFL